jgi:hypothetical protein
VFILVKNAACEWEGSLMVPPDSVIVFIVCNFIPALRKMLIIKQESVRGELEHTPLLCFALLSFPFLSFPFLSFSLSFSDGLPRVPTLCCLAFPPRYIHDLV